MTAPFVSSLCGYRDSGRGNPSTSDNNDKGSIQWGQALFEALGVLPATPEVQKIGAVMETAVADHLRLVRPDLIIQQSRSAIEFEQYQHLGVFRRFRQSYKTPAGELDNVLDDLQRLASSPIVTSSIRRIGAAKAEMEENHHFVTQLMETMPEESMLKVDITIAAQDPAERLLVGLSSKWSLRTDRAQDCVAQGAKLVNTRRGHMPHFAVITMEPRPAMLKLIAYGSGAVDCVYHLALPELRSAAKTLEMQRGRRWDQRTALERMVAQRRIRSYKDLVEEIIRLPGQ